jgi:hypothetical protein
MEDSWMRLTENMVSRVSGPMHFRLFLQPVMATIFAVMAGLADAKAGKPPYGWTLLTDKQHRADMVKDGWKDVSKVFILAIVLDAVYQYIEQKFVYPGEVVIVAFLLAIVPYLIVRGLVTRLARL